MMSESLGMTFASGDPKFEFYVCSMHKQPAEFDIGRFKHTIFATALVCRFGTDDKRWQV